MAEVRFQVRGERQGYSLDWKAWTTRKGDAYLQTRRGTGAKLSFHRSGICRWAVTASTARPALLRWDAPTVPRAGIAVLAVLAFPTLYLSSNDRPPDAKIISIRPPKGMNKATIVRIALTRNVEKDVYATPKDAEPGTFGVLMYETLYDDVAIVIHWGHAAWDLDQFQYAPNDAPLGESEIRFLRRDWHVSDFRSRMPVHFPVRPEVGYLQVAEVALERGGR